MARRPTFFILGAPKCGTTALSEYLRAHPAIFVSQPKEPHFFSADFDYYYAPGEARLEHYLKLFAEAGPEHRAVGEASVWYLYSREAARRIHDFAPDARVIAMVRDPAELVPSLHSQLRYMLDEDEPSVEVAWSLQAARGRGERMPPRVRVPAFLQYDRVARLGEQVERVFEVFPPDQRKIVLMDDLRADAGAVYRDVLAFLGIEDDDRTDFPRVNENKVHRTPALARVTQRPPRALVRAAAAVKRAAGVERLGVLEALRRRNRRVVRREPVAPAFTDELRAHFRPDVERLGLLIGRDLSAWSEPAH